MTTSNQQLMQTLYLTPDEERLFASAPAAVRKTCSITRQQRIIAETPDQLTARRNALSAAHPQVERLYAAVGGGADFADAVRTVDIFSLGSKDIAAIFFVLGTGWMSTLLRAMLADMHAECDAEAAAALSVIRHYLSEENGRFPARP